MSGTSGSSAATAVASLIISPRGDAGRLAHVVERGPEVGAGVGRALEYYVGHQGFGADRARVPDPGAVDLSGHIVPLCMVLTESHVLRDVLLVW